METKAQRVLHRIERQSTESFLPIIGPVKGALLRKLVQEHKPRRILEIGLLVGYSAILMADAYGGCTVTSLEVDPEIAAVARRNIADAGVGERVAIIVGDAKETIAELRDPFDLVLLDAAKEEYLAYLKQLEKHRLLSVRCVIVADNTKMFRDALQEYLDYVRAHYLSSEHDFGRDAMEVSVSRHRGPGRSAKTPTFS